MKRAIGLLIILAAVTTAGNAQYFIEGSLTAEYNDATPTFPGYAPEKQFADSYLSVSPLLGYRLNDDAAVGAKASFAKRKNWYLRNPYTGEDAEFERISSRWSFAVFCRYKLWGTEKFSFLVESSAYIGEGSTEEKTGSNTKKIETRSSFGLDATPLVTYDVSDKFSIITRCYFFNFGLNHLTVKDEETGRKTKYPSYGFSAGGSFYPLNFNIGFIYHF